MFNSAFSSSATSLTRSLSTGSSSSIEKAPLIDNKFSLSGRNVAHSLIRDEGKRSSRFGGRIWRSFKANLLLSGGTKESNRATYNDATSSSTEKYKKINNNNNLMPDLYGIDIVLPYAKKCRCMIKNDGSFEFENSEAIRLTDVKERNEWHEEIKKYCREKYYPELNKWVEKGLSSNKENRHVAAIKIKDWLEWGDYSRTLDLSGVCFDPRGIAGAELKDSYIKLLTCPPIPYFCMSIDLKHNNLYEVPELPDCLIYLDLSYNERIYKLNNIPSSLFILKANSNKIRNIKNTYNFPNLSYIEVFGNKFKKSPQETFGLHPNCMVARWKAHK